MTTMLEDQIYRTDGDLPMPGDVWSNSNFGMSVLIIGKHTYNDVKYVRVLWLHTKMSAYAHMLGSVTVERSSRFMWRNWEREFTLQDKPDATEH